MVYVIATGEYSDWELHGYFSDLESAYAYCYEKNEWSRRWGTHEYYVIPLHENNSVKIDSPKLYYEYIFLCGELAGNRWSFDLYDKNIGTVDFWSKPRIQLDEYNPRHRHAQVRVYLDRYDRALAEKVAQDTLYKYLAEKCIDPQPDEIHDSEGIRDGIG